MIFHTLIFPFKIYNMHLLLIQTAPLHGGRMLASKEVVLSFLSRQVFGCLVATSGPSVYTSKRGECRGVMTNQHGSCGSVSPKRALRNKSSRRRSAAVRVSTRSLALSVYSIYWRSASYVACAIVDWVMDLEYCRPSASSMTFSKHSAIERNAICRLDFHRPRVVYIVAGPKN